MTPGEFVRKDPPFRSQLFEEILRTPLTGRPPHVSRTNELLDSPFHNMALCPGAG